MFVRVKIVPHHCYGGRKMPTDGPMLHGWQDKSWPIMEPNKDVLKSLRKCRLGVENLDNPVMIYRTWPDKARLGCNFSWADVAKFFVAESGLCDTHEVELGITWLFKHER